MDILINREMPIAVYKQIYTQIVLKITNGTLKNKDKLIPERDLAKMLSVSRGTIKNAYELLIRNGYAVAEQGAGTFITYMQEDYLLKNDTIRHDIDNIIDKLVLSGLDFAEINSLFKMRILNKKNLSRHINIAAVDCNLETLSILKNQISTIENINFMVFLLEDVLLYKKPAELFSEFDLIFTTSTHYEDLENIISDSSDKIVKGIMSIDMKTIMNLANLENSNRVGVVTKTKRFAEIIRNNLRKMNIEIPGDNYVLISDFETNDFETFINNKKHLIFPPLYTVDLERKLSEKIFEYNHNGGEIIIFNYTIERGSIIYMEEKILEQFAKTLTSIE